MSLVNLYTETLAKLSSVGYSKKDVLYVCNRSMTLFLSFEKFRDISDYNFDNILLDINYPSISPDLIVLLKDGSFLKRSSKDNSKGSVECWDFRSVNNLLEINDVFCSLFSKKEPLDLDYNFKRGLTSKLDNNLVDEEGGDVFNKTVKEVSERATFLNLFFRGKKKRHKNKEIRSKSIVC